MKYLGIDYGTKNVGIALSDEEGKVAFPLQTILNTSVLDDDVAAIVTKNGAGIVVIGESLDNDGNPNPIMKKIEAFKTRLEEKIAAPVYFQNEMFSSKASERIPHRQISGQETMLGKNDAAAATIILQSYLDTLEHNHERED